MAGVTWRAAFTRSVVIAWESSYLPVKGASGSDRLTSGAWRQSGISKPIGRKAYSARSLDTRATVAAPAAHLSQRSQGCTHRLASIRETTAPRVGTALRAAGGPVWRPGRLFLSPGETAVYDGTQLVGASGLAQAVGWAARSRSRLVPVAADGRRHVL